MSKLSDALMRQAKAVRDLQKAAKVARAKMRIDKEIADLAAQKARIKRSDKK